MQGFKVEASLDGISSRKDRSISLRFSTQELPTNDKAKIFEFVDNYGWLLFSPAEISEKEIPADVALKDQKSPSQRLRAVLFVFYEKNLKGTGTTFENYYQSQLNKIIDSYKKKLGDEDDPFK